jgi:hypothetical protein
MKTLTPMGAKSENVKDILLVEDDARDAELTLAALEKSNFAMRVLASMTERRRWIIFISGEDLKTASVEIPFSCCLTIRCRRSVGWRF